jgi:hypothetical protein
MNQGVIDLALSVPFIMMLVQLCKKFIKDTEYYPHLSVGFGVILNVALAWCFASTPITRATIATALVSGAIAGGTAAGIYNHINDQVQVTPTATLTEATPPVVK